jgi:ubiquinone/menaquinone biosynthesis C-methylase UbiE
VLSSERSPWDVDGVAERIDAYWRESRLEAAHVTALGELCARYLTSRRLQVLEVGCGTGRIYRQLVPRLLGERAYTGVDLSVRMLAIARRRWPAGRFVLADGRALALADDAVDYTLAFEVVGHLPEIGRMLRELGRVGRRGFVFTAWRAGEDEVATDGCERVGDAEFLHRCYSSSALMPQIAAALPGMALEVETTALGAGSCAYVVHRCGGPPGVHAAGIPAR